MNTPTLALVVAAAMAAGIYLGGRIEAGSSPSDQAAGTLPRVVGIIALACCFSLWVIVGGCSR